MSTFLGRPFYLAGHLNTAYYRQIPALCSLFIAPITVVYTSYNTTGVGQRHWAQWRFTASYLLAGSDAVGPSVGTKIENIGIAHLTKNPASHGAARSAETMQQQHLGFIR